MTEIVFENPPGLTSRLRDWTAEANQLRARPGEWAHVSTRNTRQAAAGAAMNIRRGNLNPFNPPGAFEAISRTVGGEFRVYARYVGNGDAA